MSRKRPTLTQLENMEKVKDIALRKKQHCKDNRFKRPLHPEGCANARNDEKYLSNKMKKKVGENENNYSENKLNEQLRRIRSDIEQAKKSGRKRFQPNLKF